MSEPAIFIGTDEQLMNCLRLAANTRNCPNVHAGAMIEAADRIAALTARLATAEAERDAAEARIVELLVSVSQAAGHGERAGERRATAAIVAWLRDDAGKTRDDLTRLHRAKKLTPMMTAEWEAGIMTKAGIANAIESGHRLPSAGDAGEAAP